MRTLKEFIKTGTRDNLVSLRYYREGYLYYGLTIIPTREQVEQGHKIENWMFPIPIEDTKGGTFYSMHRAIDLMRWIRKAIEDGTMVTEDLKGGQQVNSVINSDR